MRPRVVFASLIIDLVLVVGNSSQLFADEAHQDVPAVDHFISHSSTAPAIRGQQVTLYLRERGPADVANQSSPLEGKVVLFVHGAFLGSTGAFDLPYQDYSWMAYLAQAGFDAFSLDLTGYGFSTRPGPMNDPCNLDPDLQVRLVPALHVETCAATKPVLIDTIRSDWDDVDAAVNFIRGLRHVQRVSLISWSYGGSITGGYAASHPDKVDRLVMLSPSYDRDNPGAGAPETAASGAPMWLQTPATVPSFWDHQVQCADQVDPGIREAVWEEGIVADAASWAPGLRRVPSVPTWRWNRSLATKVQAPTLVIEGEFDQMSPSSMPEVIRAAYADLGTPTKVYLDLACSSHFAQWETRHLPMFAASLEWLRAGTVNGLTSGEVRLGD